MKKYIKIFSMISLMLILSLCCGCNTNDDENKLKDGELIVNENENVIRLAVTSFDTLNPIMTKSASVAEFMKSVCEPLFEYDEAGNPIEILAKNYVVSIDGMTASFEVEPVKFHDSSILSEEDVIYTVNMIKNNDTLYSDNVKYISEIFAENGRVFIKLTKPVINFAGLLNFPIVKNGTPVEMNQNYVPIGTGPCVYYGKKTANQITFTANENWHNGETGFKEIEVKLIKDASTVVHAFDAGEVDIVSSELAKSENFAPRSEHTINEYTSNAMVFLGINNTTSKLSGKYTRKAIELLCDKKKIVDVDVYSKGEPAKVPLNPSVWFYPQIPEEANDYGSIEAILIKDGWVKEDNEYSREYRGEKQKLELNVLVNKDNEEKVKIAEDIAEALTDFGIKTMVKSIEFSSYKTNITDKYYDLFIGEVMLDKSMDPSFLLKSSWNYFGYQSQLMDDVLNEMAKTSEGDKIKEGAEKMGQIFNDEVPFVPLFFRTESVIYNKYISGITSPDSFQIYKDIDKWYISKTKKE